MDERVVIRPAGPADVPRLTELYGEMYAGLAQGGWTLPYRLDADALPGLLETQIKSKLCLVLLAEDRGTISGFLSASLVRLERRYGMAGAMGYIGDLYVRPESRRGGLGNALLAEGEAWFREKGVTAVKCEVLTTNRDGMAFWRARGYAPAATTHYKTW